MSSVKLKHLRSIFDEAAGNGSGGLGAEKMSHLLKDDITTGGRSFASVKRTVRCPMCLISVPRCITNIACPDRAGVLVCLSDTLETFPRPWFADSKKKEVTPALYHLKSLPTRLET